MLNNFETMLNSQLGTKGLDLGDSKNEKKIAKLALKIYNKINGTNFKSKAPKIIYFQVNCKKQQNIA